MSHETDEEAAVRSLGDRIGYGRMMQLAEQIWNAKAPGGAHTTGPCVSCMVPCPCTEPHRCDWCCGSRRVTERVAKAMASATRNPTRFLDEDA